MSSPHLKHASPIIRSATSAKSPSYSTNHALIYKRFTLLYGTPLHPLAIQYTTEDLVLAYLTSCEFYGLKIIPSLFQQLKVIKVSL